MQGTDACVQARNAKSLMPNRNSPQILSDKALLDTMMRGQRAAGYAPSSHWGSPKSATLAALHAVDLNNFLTVPNSFGNFPASHLERPNMFRRIGHRLRKEFSRLVGLAEPPSPLGPIVEASCHERMNFMAQEFAEALYNFDYGQCLLQVEDSLAGNPPATFEIANRRYSFQFLHNFARTQWLLRNLKIPEGACVVEIGPGYGGFIEVLRKVRPDLRIALIDIAPQLYIAEQRCKAIFGDSSQGSGSVVGFRTTTNMKTNRFGDVQAGYNRDRRAVAMRSLAQCLARNQPRLDAGDDAPSGGQLYRNVANRKHGAFLFNQLSPGSYWLPR